MRIWILNPIVLKTVKSSLLFSLLMKMLQLSLMKTIMKMIKCWITIMDTFLRHCNQTSSLSTLTQELDLCLNSATVLKQIYSTFMICTVQTRLIRPRRLNSNKVLATLCCPINLLFPKSKVVKGTFLHLFSHL